MDHRELEQLISTPPRKNLQGSKVKKLNLNDFEQLDRPRLFSVGSVKHTSQRPNSSNYRNSDGIKLFIAKTTKNSPMSRNSNIFKTINSPYFQPPKNMEMQRN